MPRHAIKALCVSFVLCGLFACSSAPVQPSDDYDRDPDHVPIDPMTVPQAVPRLEPRSRYGNPKKYEVFGKTYHVMDSGEGYRERGLASWYGQKFHGRRTSSGEPYDMFAMTAAHKTLPLPAYVRVTNLNNGRSLIVRVNDRGPFHPGRIIDLSYTAAMQLGVYAQGSAPVEVVALDPRKYDKSPPTPAPAPTIVPVPIPTSTLSMSPVPAVDTAPAAPSNELDAFIERLENKQRATATLPFIQLGAFRKMADCDGLVQKLAPHNLLALQIRAIDSDASLSCRVLQGPFATRDDADTQVQSLRTLGLEPLIFQP